MDYPESWQALRAATLARYVGTTGQNSTLHQTRIRTMWPPLREGISAASTSVSGFETMIKLPSLGQ